MSDEPKSEPERPKTEIVGRSSRELQTLRHSPNPATPQSPPEAGHSGSAEHRTNDRKGLVSFKNLTGYEINALPRSFNLTDGHAFRRWSPAEESVIDRAALLFRCLDRTMQIDLERDYIRDFSQLGKQTWDPQALGYLMCPNASMALEIMANYLRLNRLTLTLVEPCFDNLADIFLRHQIPLSPFPNRLMEAPGAEFEEALHQTNSDVICLVTPNNPTGIILSENNLRCLVRFCQERRKLLILDNCFRAYIPRDQICDQYRIILEGGIDAFLLEDTGKTWPTVEIKAPFFAVTRAGGFFDRIYDIYTDFLLHVSPFSVRLAHEFLKLSLSDDLRQVHDVVRLNRKMLYDHLEGTFLTPCERPSGSVAWLRINAPITGIELKRILEEHGVFVLPGEHFFWHDRRQGREFIRVALNRDAEMFAEASALLGKVARETEAAMATRVNASVTRPMHEIRISQDVRGEIARQGFSFIPHGAWSLPADAEQEWQRLREDWEHLEADRYLKNGATFRRRRYGRFYWSPVSDRLIPLRQEAYFQPKDENSYAGGVVREFAPLLPETVQNEFLTSLVRCTFASLPIAQEKQGKTWEVRVHQIRILASARERGEPSPEGIHQDGTDFLTLHLVQRSNVIGAESTIYDLNRRPIFQATLQEPLDSFILEDPRIMHGVTPVDPADANALGVRDLLGIDFIYNPELRRPS
jgi:aspartate/methionine/tyrosine aminotransferase